MIRNYLKVALRSLRRGKMFSAINLTGLAIGLAVCATIFLWVRDELSYDSFHRNAERIFRVERKVDFRDIHVQAPSTSGAYGPALIRDYPEVEGFCRLNMDEIAIKDSGGTFRRQRVLFADNSLFEIFDFRLTSGDSASALTAPRTLALTSDRAVQFFGTADAVGRTLTVDWNGSILDFQVTGVLDKVPANSHVRFDVVASLATYPEESMAQWFNNFIYTYVLIRAGAPPENLENKLPGFLTRYQAEQYAALLGQEADITDVFQLKLNPLLRIHMYPAEQFEIEPQGSMASVVIFSAVAVLILLIAIFNFMNLSTARAQKRAREVGLRKTVGAGRRQLWGQFIGESLLMSLMAAALAVGLIVIFTPVLNALAGKSLSAALLLRPGNLLLVLGFTLFSGLLAGLYPAFYLTAFEPVAVLKGRAQTGRGKTGFRRIMAVFQFAVSISLIICTLVIFRQLDFIQNKSLGFDKENVLLVRSESEQVRRNLEAFKSVLKSDPRILSVAGSSSVPGDREFSDTVFKRDDSDDIFDLTFLSCDYDFVETLGFRLLRGRNFSREFGAESKGAVLLNRRAVVELGLTPEEAVGRNLLQAVTAEEFRALSIIGILEDFHFKSLHRTIEPMVVRFDPDRVRMVAIRIRPGNLRETVDFVRGKWAEAFPGEEFNFGFLDEWIGRLYESENRMRDLFQVFAALSIFVACLGLLGLAAFTAQERTKEIGVRKVLGASVPNLVSRLTWEFTRWVLAANLIAWPAAYFAMNRWAGNFAYRASMGIGPFLAAAVLSLITAWLTIGFQAVKAARTDPVRALRWE